MIWIKYCKKCRQAFDIDVSKDLCLKCRTKIKKEVEDYEGAYRGRI